MENEQEKQASNKAERDDKGRLLPGSTANPNGRPKGKTIKERVREYLEQHPDDMEKFVEHFVKTNRDLAWQMLEGRPSQGVGQAEDLPPLKVVNYADINGDIKPPIQTEGLSDSTS